MTLVLESHPLIPKKVRVFKELRKEKLEMFWVAEGGLAHLRWELRGSLAPCRVWLGGGLGLPVLASTHLGAQLRVK